MKTLWIVIVSLAVSSTSVFAEAPAQPTNKVMDEAMSFDFSTEESLKIGLALAEGAIFAATFIPGKKEVVVSDERITALVAAKAKVEEAKGMINESQRVKALDEATKKFDALRKEAAELKSDAPNFKAENSRLTQEANAAKTRMDKLTNLKVVTDEVKTAAINAAKEELKTALNAVTDNSKELKAMIKSKPGLIRNTIKYGVRTFVLVDYGVKGYVWAVLNETPSYSPAGEAIWHGTKRLYNTGVDQYNKHK